LLQSLVAKLLLSLILVDPPLVLNLVLDDLELSGILLLSATAVFFKLQISLDPALHFLVLFDAIPAAILLLATSNLGLVLPLADLLQKLVALGAAVVHDAVAA
jgi:hypothetical protein